VCKFVSTIPSGHRPYLSVLGRAQLHPLHLRAFFKHRCIALIKLSFLIPRRHSRNEFLHPHIVRDCTSTLSVMINSSFYLSGFFFWPPIYFFPSHVACCTYKHEAYGLFCSISPADEPKFLLIYDLNFSSYTI
jgi:hypothetical protein